LKPASIKRTELPKRALLHSYLRNGHYTDCYSTDIAESHTHAQFIVAFYTSWLFKLERLILKIAVSKPSTDLEAKELADSQRDTFSAWSVEARDTDQLLLCDYQGRTRSWLMVEALPVEQSPQTRLYFGSAVVRSEEYERDPAKSGLSLLFRFHRLYSIALLHSAKKRLEKSCPTE